MSETFQRREARREARSDVDWIAVIRLADGTEIPCSVKDASSGGMKVMVAADQALPETFTLRVIGKDLLFRVRPAWRNQHHVGVRIERIGKLPRPADADPPGVPAAEAAPHERLGSRGRYRPGT